MKPILYIILLILITSCSISKTNDKSMNNVYSIRKNTLELNEIKLIKSIGLTENEFHDRFKDILISEILCNSRYKGYNRDSINGLIFCGKKLKIDEILMLREGLLDKGLILEASINEFIYSRFNDFKFLSIDENTLLDTPKIYYKIYQKKSGLDFLEQVSYVQEDKKELIDFYNKIITKYKGFAIWADGEENLLYVPDNLSDELLNDIYNFKDFVYPKQYGIENGWYTRESIISEYKDKLPIIDFGFYE